MKHLTLPVLALALVSFALPAAAGCGGHKHQGQTVEKPSEEPVETPST